MAESSLANKPIGKEKRREVKKGLDLPMEIRVHVVAEVGITIEQWFHTRGPRNTGGQGECLRGFVELLL